MRVLPNFITEEEEASLLGEVEPQLKRMRYEFDHWDNVSFLNQWILTLTYSSLSHAAGLRCQASPVVTTPPEQCGYYGHYLQRSSGLGNDETELPTIINLSTDTVEGTNRN